MYSSTGNPSSKEYSKELISKLIRIQKWSQPIRFISKDYVQF